MEGPSSPKSPLDCDASLDSDSDDIDDGGGFQYGYHMHVWPCALVLSSFMEINPLLFKGKRVLEVGCGMALNGVLARQLGAERVYVGDLDHVIQGLPSIMDSKGVPFSLDLGDIDNAVVGVQLPWMDLTCINRFLDALEALDKDPIDTFDASGKHSALGTGDNSRLLINRVEKAKITNLDSKASTATEMLEKRPAIEMIIASDVLYSPDEFDRVLGTIALLLTRSPDTTVYMTYQERSARRSIASLLEFWDLVAGPITPTLNPVFTHMVTSAEIHLFEIRIAK